MRRALFWCALLLIAPDVVVGAIGVVLLMLFVAVLLAVKLCALLLA
jgi:hypothetical protein